jgi:SET domain-containing protein
LDDKKMKDLSYRSPKTEVRESPIHGRGLFAKQTIAAGEIVAVKGGYIFTRKEWTTLERQLGSSEVQISEELFIAPAGEEQREGCMLYTNHSCDPNIAIQGQIVFVAMKDIAPDEELTHDWATTDDLDYVMQCNCRRPNCRRIVTGKDWMKKELQEKYKGWFCWFIQRKIDALSSNINCLNQTAFSAGTPKPAG